MKELVNLPARFARQTYELTAPARTRKAASKQALRAVEATIVSPAPAVQTPQVNETAFLKTAAAYHQLKASAPNAARFDICA